MPELEKKLIVDALMSPLSEQEFITDAGRKAAAQITYATYVTGLSPTALVMQDKVTAAQTLVDERATLRQQAKNKTTAIRAARKDITNDLVSKWAGQIQNAEGITVGRVQELFYHARNVDDGHSQSPISITNSLPLIQRVEHDLPLQHTIFVCNDTDNNLLLPKDAEQLDLYQTFDIANVTDPRKMSYLGKIKHGKYTNKFEQADLNKDVWYVAVYIPKDSNIRLVLSIAYKAKVI